MTEFDDLFADGPAQAMLDVFGEPITYTPLGGSERTITAMVDRAPRSPPPEMLGILLPGITIEVLNDPVLGIDSATFDEGGDHVTVALEKGQTPISLILGMRLEDADNGMLRFRVGH